MLRRKLARLHIRLLPFVSAWRQSSHPASTDKTHLFFQEKRFPCRLSAVTRQPGRAAPPFALPSHHPWEHKDDPCSAQQDTVGGGGEWGRASLHRTPLSCFWREHWVSSTHPTQHLLASCNLCHQGNPPGLQHLKDPSEDVPSCTK